MKESIAKKAWPVSEKKRTLDILERAPEKKTKRLIFLDEFVYWVLLFIGILGNFIISVVLVPFLLILSGFYLYAALFLIGLAFGALINVILVEIHKIEVKKHIIPGLLIAAIALINIYIMARLANTLEVKLQLLTPAHNPIYVSAVYVVAFLIPHLISAVRSRKTAAMA